MRYFLTFMTLVLGHLVSMVGADVPIGDYYDGKCNRWLEIAESCKPQLVETVVRPVPVVKAVNDTSAYQNWRFEQDAPVRISFFSVKYQPN